jgi:hypothetical protein
VVKEVEATAPTAVMVVTVMTGVAPKAIEATTTASVAPTAAEVTMETVTVVNKNKSMAGSNSTFNDEYKCAKVACCSCVHRYFKNPMTERV